jgi:hypothetical protein
MNHAPPIKASSPATTNDIRAVATYSSARNAPKNISDDPRSRMKISISIEMPQITSSGPKCLSERLTRPLTRTSRTSFR